MRRRLAVRERTVNSRSFTGVAPVNFQTFFAQLIGQHNQLTQRSVNRNSPQISQVLPTDTSELLVDLYPKFASGSTPGFATKPLPLVSIVQSVIESTVEFAAGPSPQNCQRIHPWISRWTHHWICPCTYP